MAYEEHPYGQVERPKYDCLLFDLDDTLYSFSYGLAAACGKNIRGIFALFTLTAIPAGFFLFNVYLWGWFFRFIAILKDT
ncbi:unnamed protein product [Cuscuta campestris]|uniref:Uncharacterized protein n=1 Tax=Cuscuta campestris TaxID=132261 RepID=A0A484MAU9_9ASTE|nr:unnamed protein product [Cuscuta campestris]